MSALPLLQSLLALVSAFSASPGEISIVLLLLAVAIVVIFIIDDDDLPGPRLCRVSAT